jgi:hypothetical protein
MHKKKYARSGDKYTYNDIAIDVISTGSKGNCVVLNDTYMFDIGVTQKVLKDYMYKIKYIFITHEHGDHIKPPTLLSFMKKNSIVKVYMLASVFSKHISTKFDEYRDRIVIINYNDILDINDVEFKVVEMTHGVKCVGYQFNMLDTNICYATDTTSFEKLSGLFNLMLIESNHSLYKLKAAMSEIENNLGSIDYYEKHGPKGMSKLRGQKKRIDGSLGHMSKEGCEEFRLENRDPKDSLCICLHLSESLH